MVTSIAGTKKKLLAAPGEVINDADHPPVLVDQLAKHVAKLHKSDDRGYMIEYNVIIIIFPPISPCRLKAIRANPYFELKSTLSVFHFTVTLYLPPRYAASSCNLLYDESSSSSSTSRQQEYPSIML